MDPERMGRWRRWAEAETQTVFYDSPGDQARPSGSHGVETVDREFRMKMLIVGFVIATLSKVFADEVKEWMAWLPAKVIRWAARHLPNVSVERFEEEWLAHCNDLPGNCAKLWHAIGCVTVYVRCTSGVQKAVWWT